MSLEPSRHRPPVAPITFGFAMPKGVEQSADLQIKFASMTVRHPIGKQKKYSLQELQIIHAKEDCPPEGRTPICWKLITNLAVKKS